MSSRQLAKMPPKLSGATAVNNAADSPGKSQANNETVDSRRQKKRELDRRCQRMARERTKARIAYLEGLVEDFRNQDASGRVTSLMRQLEDTVKERDELSKTLKLIENSIKSHRSDVTGATELKQEGYSRTLMPAIDVMSAGVDGNWNESDAFDPGLAPHLPSAAPNDETLGSNPEEEPTIDIRPESLTDLSACDSNYDISDEPPLKDKFTPYVGKDHDVIYPPSKVPCDCRRAKPIPSFGASVNIWRFGNETLAKRETYSDEVLEMEDALGDDIPVRALVEGWDVVEARLGGTLPPMWQRLRKVDEIIFGTCGLPERLAVMRVMHLLLRYHAQPTVDRKKAVPPWYLKRPSQTLTHSYGIDFVAWPGVRERFVFSQHRYCGNLFWFLLCRSFRLLWPFEFRDTYTYNTLTRQYKISGCFEERIRDINAWTMSRDIFRRWPEFYGDFPTWGHMPMEIGDVGIHSRRHDKSGYAQALMPAQSESHGFAAGTVGSNHGHSWCHPDRNQSVDHRQLAEEVDDEAVSKYHQRDSVASVAGEIPNNLISVQSYSDCWEYPLQFGLGQSHAYPGPVEKSADFAMPVAASAPQETLSAMSQMYDLPI